MAPFQADIICFQLIVSQRHTISNACGLTFQQIKLETGQELVRLLHTTEITLDSKQDEWLAKRLFITEGKKKKQNTRSPRISNGMTHAGGVTELMPKNTLEISKLQKTISQFKKCYIQNEQFRIRFHLDRKEQSIVKIEISASLGKNDCDNHVLIYGRRIKTKPVHLLTYLAFEWDQRYMAMLFPGQTDHLLRFPVTSPHFTTATYSNE